MTTMVAWNGGNVVTVPEAWRQWRHNGVAYWRQQRRYGIVTIWAQAEGATQAWWYDARGKGHWREGTP